MDDRRGDDFSEAFRIDTPEEVAHGLRELVHEWKDAAAFLQRGLAPSQAPKAASETANAWVCYHAFRSTFNTLQVYALRTEWSSHNHARYREILADEVENLRAALRWIGTDHRFGWHAEAEAHMFNPASVTAKLRDLEDQLEVKRDDNDAGESVPND